MKREAISNIAGHLNNNNYTSFSEYALTSTRNIAANPNNSQRP